MIEAFKWRDVILIYEDTDSVRDIILYFFDFFYEKNIRIAFKNAFSTTSEDDHIIEELQKLKELQTTVFVVHASHFLVSRICLTAKSLGMMNEGYVWIMTTKSMNVIHSMDSSVIESMQGVIGFKSYIPPSKKLENFTKRWRRKIHAQQLEIEVTDLSAYSLWAYDFAWALAKAIEKVNWEIAFTHKPNKMGLNLIDLYNLTTSKYGSMLTKEILQSRFKGLSGAFQFVDGKLVLNTFEIVNVIGRGERRVGYWNAVGNITRELYSLSNNGSNLSSYSSSSASYPNDLEDIIWPGGSATTPKGFVMKTISQKLRIGVPVRLGFQELVKVDHDPQTNTTVATGFCVDIFKTAIQTLPYDVYYEFIPFNVTKLQSSAIHLYNDLIDQVYLQNIDGAVGDITITANRSLYVDFTLPFTDMGSAMVAPKQNEKGMWIFLKPLTKELWLSSAGFFLLTGFIVWVIEQGINNEFQGSPSQQIGTIFWFSFSTLVFASGERLLSNLSKFVVLVWAFVVLIFTSSYTATLTSMMTARQIQLNSKENDIIWYEPISSHAHGDSNLHFENFHPKTFNTEEEFVKALSKGRKNGGVSAIVDRLPYIKLFLAKYPKNYSMVGPIMHTTNGFGFAFRKGSPLVPHISRAIAKLREEGKLAMMENAWLKSHSTLASELEENADNDVKPLTFESFRGLFFISGISSTFALAIFFVLRLHKKWQVVKSYNFHFSDCSLKTIFQKKIVRRVPQTNVMIP
ncbi:hypothetical protein P3X46_018157 [Hevea brasiliensis]|uniref:Ionotropic glutamate receptor C-terminal domain-containing protein n=1 Tax=Hevea brasiliensis TaxID=3981 RepID=A0ABQ9LT10_HEVBR|nr:hypothetical protein P3X46_018157 [Hevea brasiliensis]